MESKPGIPIPYEQLATETLRSVVEELVTRDGTELTGAEAKVEQVLRLLRSGQVTLWYDEATRTCSLLPT